MTTPIKTQCPHCHAAFSLPSTKLNQADAKGRCGRCQQVFLLNDYLIVSADDKPAAAQINTHQQAADDTEPSNHNKVANNKTTNNKDAHSKSQRAKPVIETKVVEEKDTKLDSVTLDKSKSNDTKSNDDKSDDNLLFHDDMEIEDSPYPVPDLDDDLLFHDDMEIDDSPESITAYGSLEEMDAWLSQSDTSDATDNASTAPAKAVPEKSTPAASDMLKKPAAASVSSTDANDIHANVATTSGNDTSENAWLEALLKAQQDSDNALPDEDAADKQDNTDLSQLLENIGMATNNKEKISQARTNRIHTHTQQGSTPSKNPIATILWLVGSLILILLLLAQYVIFNLDTLIKNPDHAARLQTVCSMAACSLPHADIADLSTTEPSYRPSRIKAAAAFSDIETSLVNQSQHSQLLPNIKVTIYGDNALIGAFIAPPKDYLLSPQSQIAAESSKSMMFTVPVATNQINNITIDVIY
jgi:predicted Zn finger-like uncharacterized protein